MSDAVGAFAQWSGMVGPTESPKEDYWDKPNGCCSHCGAPLNEYLVGGYKLHDGTFAVAAKPVEKK